MKIEKIPHLLLRIGVAFAFLYPPLDALFSPYTWIGYFPQFMRGFVPDLVLLHAFGAVEVIIAFWLLSGKRILIPSALAAIILLAIVTFDFQDFEIVFRDLSIALAAAALAVEAWQISHKR